MNVPKPHNSQETVRLANVWTRAKAIAASLKTGAEYVAYHQGGNIWGVTKRSFTVKPDTTYLVDMNPPKPTCTCPDFSDHLNYCKHTLGLTARLEEDAQLAQLELLDMEADGAELETTGCDPFAKF